MKLMQAMNLREGTRRLALFAGGAGFVFCGLISLSVFQDEFRGRTAVPSAWNYIVQAVLPLIGFAVPWCIVRGIGWVLAGFLQPWPNKNTT